MLWEDGLEILRHADAERTELQEPRSTRGMGDRERGGQRMDILKMLGELKDQRERLDRMILAAENIARAGGKRRGRPPAFMRDLKRRGRPPGSKNKTEKSSAAA